MSKSNLRPQQLDRLIARYLDGEISAEELASLENELSFNSDARKRLREIATIEEGLEDYALVTAGFEFESEQPHVHHVDAPFHNWIAITSMAVMFFVVLTFSSFLVSDNEPDVVQEADIPFAIEKQNFVAYVVDNFEAKFEGHPIDDITNLQSGEFTLIQGFIHLRFRNGATMILAAPAKFAIENESNFKLYDGDLRVLVPPTSKGFRVSSPGVDFQDFGSEFAIRANAAASSSEISVFQGQVNSKLSDGQVVQALVSGQAAVYRNGIVEFGKADSSNFIEPGQIGFKRWKRDQIKLQNEPELIGYFPFVEGEPGIVQNFAQHPELVEFEKISDGIIGAATWVQGRWPGKRALMFESSRDFFELNFPGRYSELTIATWIKLDRIANSFNAILNSHGWSQGAVHLQLNRWGGPWIATYDAHNIKSTDKVPVGRWVHLAATLSTKEKKGKVYLNGKLISESDLSENAIIRPAQCRIGNWLNTGNDFQSRALYGRMDELMIWKKALSKGKIKKLAKQGIPRRLNENVSTANAMPQQ